MECGPEPKKLMGQPATGSPGSASKEEQGPQGAAHKPNSSQSTAPINACKGQGSSQELDSKTDAVAFKGDDACEDEPGSFSGVSHPPEPVDTDLMRTPDSEEKECVWDASLPPSGNVSPHSSIDSTGLVTAMSIVNSCCTSTYRSDGVTSDGMLSMDRTCESAKGSVRGDSLESAKTSLSRASDSSGLSDDSNWSNTCNGIVLRSTGMHRAFICVHPALMLHAKTIPSEKQEEQEVSC
ncbi:hypothetical protein Taro_012963 [Colocasia esculenta]|uniref:Uncharacterized protein n=1 Tax=Colocasia esculenta TaxID=4460 RepID=A0A843UEN0_COLES|nr:hypothetical protein [Colocasia esculenta]